MRRVLTGFLVGAVLAIPMATTTVAAAPTTARMDTPLAIATCLQQAHAPSVSASPSLAKIAGCAPNAVVLANASGGLPPGEYIVPSRRGYAVEINQAGPVRQTASSTRCQDVHTWWIDPGFDTLDLSGWVCWNGRTAWTDYIGASCSVWVPGPPGTSCGSYYTYEWGRNTNWDYPNGVFHYAILFFYSVCMHGYFENTGARPGVAAGWYGC